MLVKNIILSTIVVIGLGLWGCDSASATNWYVRDGGSSLYNTTNNPTGGCNGTTNAIYPGSGVNQNCAISNPDYVLGLGCDNYGKLSSCTYAPKIQSGDIVYIDGDSDLNPGSQAQYQIGYNPSSKDYFNGNYGNCKSSWAYACTMGNLPAGLSLTQPTSIIGTGTNKPKLLGINSPYQIILADNNYISLQNLEITDNTACAYNDPTDGCRYDDGIWLGGTGLTLSNVYVHGLSRYGIVTDNMGNATFTNLWVIGNGYGGFTVGNGTSVSMEWLCRSISFEWRHRQAN
jgi:hypothetical protein